MYVPVRSFCQTRLSDTRLGRPTPEMGINGDMEGTRLEVRALVVEKEQWQVGWGGVDVGCKEEEERVGGDRRGGGRRGVGGRVWEGKASGRREEEE